VRIQINNTILFRKTPLKAQNITIFFKNLGGHGLFAPAGYAYGSTRLPIERTQKVFNIDKNLKGARVNAGV